MGVAQPAVADQCEEPLAGVGQFEGPELVEPGAAQRGVDRNKQQDRTEAGDDDDARERDLAPAGSGGSRWEGADIDSRVAQERSLRRACPGAALLTVGSNAGLQPQTYEADTHDTIVSR
jgi:hypothetical protein